MSVLSSTSLFLYVLWIRVYFNLSLEWKMCCILNLSLLYNFSIQKFPIDEPLEVIYLVIQSELLYKAFQSASEIIGYCELLISWHLNCLLEVSHLTKTQHFLFVLFICFDAIHNYVGSCWQTEIYWFIYLFHREMHFWTFHFTAANTV